METNSQILLHEVWQQTYIKPTHQATTADKIDQRYILILKHFDYLLRATATGVIEEYFCSFVVAKSNNGKIKISVKLKSTIFLSQTQEFFLDFSLLREFLNIFLCYTLRWKYSFRFWIQFFFTSNDKVQEVKKYSWKGNIIVGVPENKTREILKREFSTRKINYSVTWEKDLRPHCKWMMYHRHHQEIWGVLCYVEKIANERSSVYVIFLFYLFSKRCIEARLSIYPCKLFFNRL